ncbi:MAG: FHA domain-containing protein [Candidatus Eremiobacteraeota bacterium]|nr:FHA domain-containing protein [Candidatus Eremiobacteraeota bacterium]
MSFDAHMRVGSLEMLAALLVVALAASRPRSVSEREIGQLNPVRVALKIIQGQAERTFEATCPITIGRTQNVELPISDSEVSRVHARLETHGPVVYLRDLGSSNGTFLNGRRVARAIEIRPTDEIHIGTTRLIVEQLNPWT